MSKYGGLSGPYFPVFGLNTVFSLYSVQIQIQSRKNSVSGHFSRSASLFRLFCFALNKTYGQGALTSPQVIIFLLLCIIISCWFLPLLVIICSKTFIILLKACIGVIGFSSVNCNSMVAVFDFGFFNIQVLSHDLSHKIWLVMQRHVMQRYANKNNIF